ncbi:Protein-disulfide isomerase [Tenacibaculum sp. MAR_2009_124]|uniref:vitamin K epoxide reductase family protein n=1 Tax=Tenacibaculum sp. MAR_2009_124 TaxID=1250059 RepID=UPI00089916E7|nr:vitamin K epoxide reductase family protein [Tenacibaculum sp. MAR_2009_124]SEC22974.1 Protein-disulfide isomerase [Tenacibaculum sp. MAR_2009_124]
MKKSLNFLVSLLLKKNKISFDKDELSFQIESHPSYPSLHAITGVLDHFNIENVAAEVPATEDILGQLPDIFLAQIKTPENGEELVVVERSKEIITIVNIEGKKKLQRIKEFLEVFTGIIVAVEKTDEVQVISKSDNRTLKYVAYILLFGLFSVLIFKHYNNVFSVFHLLLSVVGFIVSVAILRQEFGLQSSIGDAFCSETDDKKDCDAVLTSKGAEILKGFKLSDFSIVYFGTMILFTLIQIGNPNLALLITYAAIPVTLYSIYYQYAVLKKWCLLCLSIVGVLWLQAIVTFFITPQLVFEINSSLFFVVISLSLLVAWTQLRPILNEVIDLRKEKVKSTKFKRNFGLFQSLLNKSTGLNTAIDDSQEIVFGNLDSNLELVVITNPFCGHCKPVHKHIEEILQKYPNAVKIRVRFNVNTSDVESELVKITSKLIHIYHERGKETCLVAMKEIYEEGNAKVWLKNWGEDKAVFVEELEREKDWCQENGINFTPEILINGKAFPKEYDRSDLVFFIEELEEQSEVVN